MWSLLLHVAALYSVGIHAAPLVQRDNTVSASELATFELFPQYSGAAYCFDSVHKNGTISCSSGGGNCPLVESANASVLNAFQAGSTKTLGYVAVDPTNSLIVCAIQGTQVSTNPVNVLTDVDIIRSKTDLCGDANTTDGCLVHDGFHNAMQDAATVVLPAVQAALQEYPDYKVITTGHSLGAAVSALLGTLLRNNGIVVDMYTFGQPKLGEVDISNYIQNQAPSQGMNYRVTHYNDIVPQLPEHEPGDWDHYYPEFWIDIGNGTVTPANIKVVEGRLFETGGNEGAKTASALP